MHGAIADMKYGAWWVTLLLTNMQYVNLPAFGAQHDHCCSDCSSGGAECVPNEKEKETLNLITQMDYRNEKCRPLSSEQGQN